MTDNSAYREGHDSYRRGVPLTNNPHKPRTREYVYWDQGWIQGRLEKRNEKAHQVR